MAAKKKSVASLSPIESRLSALRQDFEALQSDMVTRYAEYFPGFIKKGDLSRERSEQRPDRFAVGEKVDAKVIKSDRSGKLDLSIKAREIDEDKAKDLASLMVRVASLRTQPGGASVVVVGPENGTALGALRKGALLRPVVGKMVPGGIEGLAGPAHQPGR